MERYWAFFSWSYEFPGPGDTGYIYIKGKIEAARYRLAYVDQHRDIVYYLDVYQDDVAIIDLDMDGPEILGGKSGGLSHRLVTLMTSLVMNTISIIQVQGIFMEIMGIIYIQMILSIHMLHQIIHGSTWLRPLEVFLLWVSGGDPVAGIATAILSKLVASISSL